MAEFEVECIRKMRVELKGKVEYKFFLVKWKGYPESDNTWEPEESFHKSRDLVDDFMKKEKKKFEKKRQRMMRAVRREHRERRERERSLMRREEDSESQSISEEQQEQEQEEEEEEEEGEEETKSEQKKKKSKKRAKAKAKKAVEAEEEEYEYEANKKKGRFLPELAKSMELLHQKVLRLEADNRHLRDLSGLRSRRRASLSSSSSSASSSSSSRSSSAERRKRKRSKRLKKKGQERKKRKVEKRGKKKDKSRKVKKATKKKRSRDSDSDDSVQPVKRAKPAGMQFCKGGKHWKEEAEFASFKTCSGWRGKKRLRKRSAVEPTPTQEENVFASDAGFWAQLASETAQAKKAKAAPKVKLSAKPSAEETKEALTEEKSAYEPLAGFDEDIFLEEEALLREADHSMTQLFHVGDKTFQNYGDLVAHFRPILHDVHEDGDRLTASEEQDVVELLKQHERYAQKIGDGIDHIFIGHNTDHLDEDEFKQSRCFVVRQKGGKCCDFSYLKIARKLFPFVDIKYRRGTVLHLVIREGFEANPNKREVLLKEFFRANAQLKELEVHRREAFAVFASEFEAANALSASLNKPLCEGGPVVKQNQLRILGDDEEYAFWYHFKTKRLEEVKSRREADRALRPMLFFRGGVGSKFDRSQVRVDRRSKHEDTREPNEEPKSGPEEGA